MAYRVFWEEAVRRMKDVLGSQEFDSWFPRIEYNRTENENIVLTVPSSFYRDQITSRYLSQLKSILHELYGDTVGIEFEVNETAPEKTPVQRRPFTAISSPAKGKSIPVEANRPQNHPLLSRDYSFDNFVIGENNNFAANGAIAISKNPGTGYNPYLIYGGVGLGKTHLIQSIGNSIWVNFPEKKIIYVTMENFANEFVDGIHTKKSNQFKNKYRNTDVLLVDDIHFLQNKLGIQEELFHTFNALYEQKKQMVFTCDRPVSELQDLTDRLRNRFERGLKVDLQPPNYETRYAILKQKMETYRMRGIEIPNESLEIIAQNITSNVRDLEAALTKIIAYAELVGKQITAEITYQQLGENFSSPLPKNISIDIIQRSVASYFNLSPQDLKSKKKTKAISFPRQVAMYISREITEFSTTEIGLEFGGRDHTTVMHGCQRVTDRMKTDPTTEAMLKKIIKMIKENSSKR